MFPFWIRTCPRVWPFVMYSAGIGRTGTYIACDILMRLTQNKSKLNIFKTVLKLREQRTNMVQTQVITRKNKYTLAFVNDPRRADKKSPESRCTSLLLRCRYTFTESRSKWAPSEHTHLLHRSCHCWKQRWKSCFGIFRSSAVALILMFSTVSKRLRLRPILILGNNRKADGVKSGE